MPQSENPVRLTPSIAAVAIAAALVLGAGSVGHAAGEKDDTPTCAKAEIFDQAAKKCVKESDKTDKSEKKDALEKKDAPEKKDGLDKKDGPDKKDKTASDADRTKYAYALAKAQRYDEALAMLNTLAQPNTAQALNYRGYVTRKLGRTDEGIGYYLKAVAIDPKYPKVREYLGEAYLIKGRLDLAKEQLATIRTLCGTGCEEYRDLQAAIRSQPKAW